MDTYVHRTSGSIVDDSFLSLNEVRFKVFPEYNGEANAITLRANFQTTAVVLGDGYFTDINLSQNLGKTVVISPNTETTLRVAANSVCYIAIKDFHLISCVDGKNPKLQTPSKFYIPFEDLVGYKLNMIRTLDNYLFKECVNIKDVAISIAKTYPGTIFYNIHNIYGDTSVIKDIKGTASEFGSMSMQKGGLIGDITDFTSILYERCTSFRALGGHTQLGGTVESLVEAISAKGRRSGSLAMHLMGTSCTFNNAAILKTITATFNSDGTFTIS